jgi:hypothetical protein
LRGLHQTSHKTLPPFCLLHGDTSDTGHPELSASCLPGDGEQAEDGYDASRSSDRQVLTHGLIGWLVDRGQHPVETPTLSERPAEQGHGLVEIRSREWRDLVAHAADRNTTEWPRATLIGLRPLCIR